MNRFLVIEDNKIVAERIGTSICEGEILADESHGNIGQKLIDGEWIDDDGEFLKIKKQELLLAIGQHVIDGTDYTIELDLYNSL